MAHFDIPLDLPHAGRLAGRIVDLLGRYCAEKELEAPAAIEAGERLEGMLFKYVSEGENPPEAEGVEVAGAAADVARGLVGELEAAGIGFDRLGQYIRNLFECLAMGEEGAGISLRAGEDPNSLQRPI